MRFDLEAVRARLPGRRLDWFDTIGSTMIEAARDPEPGRIVGAEEQTAGVGRHGRRWHSPAGQGLYLSMVLPARPAPVVMLALGVAVWSRLSGLLPTVDLRWPNDVLVNGRKCAGILAQVEGESVIAGIGINVSQTAFPPHVDTPATSLELEGIRIAREELLVGLVAAVERCCALPAAETLVQFASASSFASGRRVRAEAGGRPVEGVTCGLDRAGFLRVREDNGTEITILAGGVRPI